MPRDTSAPVSSKKFFTVDRILFLTLTGLLYQVLEFTVLYTMQNRVSSLSLSTFNFAPVADFVRRES